MKLERHDWSKLAGGLLTMLLLIALGAATVIYSRERVSAAQAAFSAARIQRNEIVGKLGQAHGEENEIRRKAEVFNRLAARGVIGEEQRLAWVELLKELRDRLRLAEIHYEFSPQRMLETAGAKTDAFGLHVSAMRLKAKLLHEEDLIRLLDELRRLASALIQVKRCNVERLPHADMDSGSLQADCLIDWVTLREADRDEENAQ